MSYRLEKNFRDWENSAFGFGYGSGEEHVMAALKTFFGAVGRDDHPHAYDYKRLENACGATVAWLLINALCRHQSRVIEYGTSPRYGWLTPEGERLKAFVDARSAEDLARICCEGGDDTCYPDACNCGPNGYEEGRRCDNPFWPSSR
jgi:hypothetical protein